MKKKFILKYYCRVMEALLNLKTLMLFAQNLINKLLLKNITNFDNTSHKIKLTNSRPVHLQNTTRLCSGLI